MRFFSLISRVRNFVSCLYVPWRNLTFIVRVLKMSNSLKVYVWEVKTDLFGLCTEHRNQRHYTFSCFSFKKNNKPQLYIEPQNIFRCGMELHKKSYWLKNQIKLFDWCKQMVGRTSKNNYHILTIMPLHECVTQDPYPYSEFRVWYQDAP